MHAPNFTCAYQLTDRSRKEGRAWLAAAELGRARGAALAAASRSASVARATGAWPSAAWGCWTSAWSVHRTLTRANTLPC